MSELRLTRDVYEQMVSHCLDAYPLEGCGLLAATSPDSTVVTCYPTRNIAESSRVYTVDPGDHLRIDRSAEEAGLQIVGVFHSHTHTPAYPSPTDVSQAPDPSWHYVLISLARARAEVQSFRLVDGAIDREQLVVES